MKLKHYANARYLSDFADLGAEAVREKIVKDFAIQPVDLEPFQVLVAYMSEGDHGCDSSAFLLLRHRETGDLAEVHGSHCSCHGFEGQFSPEVTTLEYLRSNNFSFSCGGYDYEEPVNKLAVEHFLKEVLR